MNDPTAAVPQRLTLRRSELALLTAGTSLIGLSGYAFLALAGHGRFSAESAAALSSTYLLVSILGPGLFVAVEQETSRRVSDALVRMYPPQKLVRRTGAAAATVAGITIAGLLLASGPLVATVLRGQFGLLAAILLSVAGSAAVFWIRGLSGGQRRYGRYAATLLIDAAVRIAGCSALAVAGAGDPVAYAVALCAGPLVASVCTWRGVLPAPHTEPSRSPDTASPGLSGSLGSAGSQRLPGSLGSAGIGRAIGWLLVASVLSMTLANLAPVVVNAALPADPALAFAFAGALVLTRVPLLLMGPVQALVLPRLAAAVATAKLERFRRELGTGLLLIGGLGAVGVLGAWWLGRPVIRLVFGTAADLIPAGTVALLALSAAFLMAVSLLQPALVALGRHAGMVFGWLLGGLTFGIGFALPLDPLSQGLVAQLAGPGVTLLVHLLLVRSGSADSSTAQRRVRS